MDSLETPNGLVIGTIGSTTTLATIEEVGNDDKLANMFSYSGYKPSVPKEMHHVFTILQGLLSTCKTH